MDKDFLYKKIGDRELYLTLREPTKKVYDKAPIYFLTPGGGWHSAIRASMFEFGEYSVKELGERGFASIAVDYRVYNTDKVSMTEVMEDCYDALRFIVEKSDELGLDKDKIVFSGHSAGAHIALMLGYTSKKMGIDCNTLAVAAFSAPTILYDLPDRNTLRLGDINDLFQDNMSNKEKYSPYNYVDENCPPTILCAATSDRLVYANSSELLYDKLVKNGVDTELLLSVHGDHLFEKLYDNLEPTMSLLDMQKASTEFILKYMD